MGLGIRNNTLLAAMGAITRIYRAVIIRKAYELDEGNAGKLGFLQATGAGDPDDSDNVELVQEGSLDHAQPYGFDSSPPADCETIVLETDAGEVAVGERYPTPKTLPDRATGDVLVYSLGGHHIHLDDSGDLVVEPKSGQYVKLGDGATKKVALNGDKTAADTTMSNWITKVQAVVVAIDPTIVAPTDFGVVSASSTKIKAE